MSLRKRLFSLFAPLLVVPLLIVQLLSDHLLLRRFDQQDEQNLQNAASKAQQILFDHIEQAAQLLRSYSWWDQSYAVAQARSHLHTQHGQKNICIFRVHRPPLLTQDLQQLAD